MTLLELTLALALSVIVLGAIAMAINIFLRTLDARRTQVEETQIARGVLRLISDDLRCAVQHEELDFSKVTGIGVVSQAAASALGGAAGGSTSGAGSGSGSGSGSSGNNNNNSANGSSTKGGSSNSGGSATKGGGSSGSATKGGSGSNSNSNSNNNSQNSGSGSNNSNSGNSNSGSNSSSTQPATSNASENIQETTEPPPQPGLFGNQYELLIDVSRLPRLDEQLTRQMSADGQSVVDLPSDIKTVAYYIRSMTAQPGTGFSAAGAGSALGREMRRPGLVRRQMDRAVTVYASQSGRTSDLQLREQLVAPEVVGIEFRYFDGSQWLSEWDSIVMQGLPKAVEIQVAVQPGGEQFSGATDATARPNTTPQAPVIYRQLVRLPAARTVCPPAASGESADPAAASGNATNSGTSGGSGTPGGTMP